MLALRTLVLSAFLSRFLLSAFADRFAAAGLGALPRFGGLLIASTTEMLRVERDRRKGFCVVEAFLAGFFAGLAFGLLAARVVLALFGADFLSSFGFAFDLDLILGLAAAFFFELDVLFAAAL